MNTKEAITVSLTGDELAFLLAGMAYTAAAITVQPAQVKAISFVNAIESAMELGPENVKAFGERLHGLLNTHYGEHIASVPLVPQPESTSPASSDAPHAPHSHGEKVA